MADLRGTSGSVTFGGSDGPTVTDIVRWDGTIEKMNPADVTRFGYTMQRLTFGVIRGAGTLTVVVSNDVATMPIPTGTAATLTLLEDSGQSYAFSASLQFLRKIAVQSNNGAPQQFAVYGWVCNAQNSSNITVA